MARETDGADSRAATPGPGGTPEGHTPEAAALDEFGKKGTPAAGLTPDAPHAADALDADALDADAQDAQAADAQAGEEHAGADEHAAEPLGPIDWPAWGASALGVLVALLIAAALALPTGP